MSNLEITTESRDNEILIRCKGRLDANHTEHLSDTIDDLVRNGHYVIALDFTEVEYMSSAGIRLLVSQYKKLHSVNGIFYLADMSSEVEQILKMVGMAHMLAGKSQNNVISSVSKVKGLNCDNYNFKLEILSQLPHMEIDFYGSPEKLLAGTFSKSDMRTVKAHTDYYAFGLGAIGDSYDSCKMRFGEYIMLGGNIAYLPADGSKKPDYMINSGELIGSLSELYGIHFSGKFSNLIRFETTSPNDSITLSRLIENINQLTGYKQFVMVMISQVNGLVGVSLNKMPIATDTVFNYPEIKENVNFTTEPEHNKMLAVSVGFFGDSIKEIQKKFTRPITPLSSTEAHIHTALFPYIPLKKSNIDLQETIDALFDSGTLKDILHLTYDSREIVGLGESEFIHGFCWVAPVSDNYNNIK